MKMTIFHTVCLKFGHLCLVAGLISLSHLASTTKAPTHQGRGRASRGPASEITVRPEVQLEMSKKLNPNYNESIFDENAGNFKGMKAQVDQWRKQNEDSSHSHYRLENPQYFESNSGVNEARRQAVTTFLINSNRDRYLDPVKDDLKEWWDMKNDSNTIEGSGDVRFGAKPKPVDPTAQPTNVFDETPFYKKFDLKVKPRLEKGRVYVDLKNPYFILESTFTVQGKKEIIFRKNFSSVGLSANMQHDFNNGLNSTNLDKNLVENVVLRASHNRSIAGITDQRVQLMFGKAF